ncbi:hypothetical protein Tco_0818574 [Tanacetum coccineum]
MSFVAAIKWIAHKRLASVVVAKIMFGAMVYYICTRVETSTTTQNPNVDNCDEKSVRIIPGPAGIIQAIKLRKQAYIQEGDIKNYIKNEKLDQVVAIIKSCALNALGDLTLTLKDLSGAALILANVSVFSPKSLMHYVNIITRNLAKVSRNVTNQQEHQHRLDQESLILALEEEAREAKADKSDRVNVARTRVG